MTLFKITCRFSGRVLFERKAESLKLCVQAAIEAKINLSDAYLSDADLRGANLRGAYLRGANLSDADLSSSYLHNADLRSADLRGADLRSAYLSDAYLSDANLRGADLRGADLRSAYLSDADLRGADLRGAYLSDAKVARSITIGPIGSRRASFLAVQFEDGSLRFWVGCQAGITIETFRARVETDHGESEHGQHYRAALVFIEAWAATGLPSAKAEAR